METPSVIIVTFYCKPDELAEDKRILCDFMEFQRIEVPDNTIVGTGIGEIKKSVYIIPEEMKEQLNLKAHFVKRYYKQYSLSDMEFESSYLWQIYVWKKLYALVMAYADHEKKLRDFFIHYAKFHRNLFVGVPQETFKTLVEAVKWYNEQLPDSSKRLKDHNN